MFRRKPTAITLTTEDIAIYEDARAREAAEQQLKEDHRNRDLSQNKKVQGPKLSRQNERLQHVQMSRLTTQDRIFGEGSSTSN